MKAKGEGEFLTTDCTDFHRWETEMKTDNRSRTERTEGSRRNVGQDEQDETGFGIHSPSWKSCQNSGSVSFPIRNRDYKQFGFVSHLCKSVSSVVGFPCLRIPALLQPLAQARFGARGKDWRRDAAVTRRRDARATRNIPPLRRASRLSPITNNRFSMTNSQFSFNPTFAAFAAFA